MIISYQSAFLFTGHCEMLACIVFTDMKKNDENIKWSRNLIKMKKVFSKWKGYSPAEIL
jgi:hypothetical protein